MNSLYRGKALEIVSEDSYPDLDWVYGNLVEELCSGRCFIADVDHISCIDGEAKVSDIMIEVDPETVGQYVATCGNGDKIFTGDIMEDTTGDRYYVNFDEEECQYVRISMDGGTPVQTSFDWFDATHSKIIGNIYDNPELMEEEHGYGEWIKIPDRMPDCVEGKIQSKTVLAYDGKAVCLGYFLFKDEKSKRYYDKFLGSSSEDWPPKLISSCWIRWWMEIPQDGWITEHKPPKNIPVLVKTNNQRVILGRLGHRWILHHTLDEKETITAWMPLPKPPVMMESDLGILAEDTTFTDD